MDALLKRLPVPFRSRFGLLVFAALSLLTLSWLFSPRRPPPHPSARSGWFSALVERPPANLEEQIEISEAWYAANVRDRHDYIRRLGGENAIASWPAGGLDTPWTLWDFFPPTFQCPHRVERLGTYGDGGKYVCGIDVIGRKANPVVYSFGINGESSFEAAILDRAPGAEVWGYDFSVDSFGPEITSRPELARRSHFFKYVIGNYDSFGPEKDPNWQVYSLETLMRINGHDFVDILKVDIEGSEYEVLSGLLPSGPHYRPLPFGQLQVEIHVWDHNANFSQFLHWWEDLENRGGLRPFRSEPNLVYVNYKADKPLLSEYSFLNIRGRHELIADMYPGQEA